MALHYRRMPVSLTARVCLVMTDVDGTLTSADESIGAAVCEAIHRLEESGIAVGLVSGRTLPMLDALAGRLGITGPLIAENGGVARVRCDAEPVDLGYSRQPALAALARLKRLFPAIREREDNAERLVDVVFFANGADTAELGQHLDGTQLLDSGYILHIMQRGISKGDTLMRLVRLPGGRLSPEDVIVFGDSPTDLSLFELFPHTVLIPNPRLPDEDTRHLRAKAGFVSDLSFGEGFAQVANHIADAGAEGAPSLAA